MQSIYLMYLIEFIKLIIFNIEYSVGKVMFVYIYVDSVVQVSLVFFDGCYVLFLSNKFILLLLDFLFFFIKFI